MGLLDMDLLVTLGFPLLNQQQLICVCFGEIVIIPVTSVLGAYRRKNSFFRNGFYKSLSLAGDTPGTWPYMETRVTEACRDLGATEQPRHFRELWLSQHKVPWG